mgnify:CR=1 FL=1
MITERTVVKTELDVDWYELGLAVESAVMAKMAKGLKTWADEIDMRAMTVSDAADGLRVAEELAFGRVKEAKNRLWDMDTAPREDVYDIIERIAGEKFIKHFFG